MLHRTEPGYDDILTDDALTFLEELVEKFGGQLTPLLVERERRQAAYDAGRLPGFLPDTRDIRSGDWTIRGIPADLQDRRVEITGPVDRKMVINALNADVKVFMADFEDSLAPTWDNVMAGQVNLRDANRGTLTHTDPRSGKHYALRDDPAVLIARVRGLHLPEKHIRKDDEAVPGCLVDFALYFFHNYQSRLARGTGVYFYIPKIQCHEEARWWSAVFAYTEDRFDLPRGTIKATFLIETLPAVFEMDEILYEARDHVVALNCGRWDYIFSYIKTLRNHADRVLPDRQSVTMDKPFLSAYSRLLIRTCHRRGALAMGGMAAFIPQKDAAANQAALDKVRADKTLEARNGHDGTWVAHPGLADTAMAVFDAAIGDGRQNQLHVTRAEDAPVSAADLLAVPAGNRTEAGLRANIRVALQYLDAWIGGNGCVPIYGLMEDAATAEISRLAIWQWIRHGVTLDTGKKVTADLFRTLLAEEAEVVAREVGENRFGKAAQLFAELTVSDNPPDFLTLPAYDLL